MANHYETRSETLGDDLLWGREAIARFIGKSVRQTTYLLETGRIPGGKVGAQWCASRAALRQHFASLTRIQTGAAA